MPDATKQLMWWARRKVNERCEWRKKGNRMRRNLLMRRVSHDGILLLIEEEMDKFPCDIVVACLTFLWLRYVQKNLGDLGS